MSRYRRVARQDSGLVAPTRVSGALAGANRIVIDRLQLLNRSSVRSAELLSSVAELDATVDKSARAEIMAWINEEYEGRQGGSLMGLFAKCYLGPPYVDHKLSLLEDILEHYSPADDPGFPYNNARGLVRSGAYAYVEIYSDGAIVPIREDGSPVDFNPNA